jgi:hypothetical protein
MARRKYEMRRQHVWLAQDMDTTSAVAHWSAARSMASWYPQREASEQVMGSILVHWYIAHNVLCSWGVGCFRKSMKGDACARRCAFGSPSIMTSCVTRPDRGDSAPSNTPRPTLVGCTNVIVPIPTVWVHQGRGVCNWRLSSLGPFLLSPQSLAQSISLVLFI